MTAGHGHVVPRPDGVKARCGGPALCSECARELAALQQLPKGDIYRERAHLVAFLAKVYPSVIGYDAAEPEWPVVYISTSQGQLSWHISKNDLDLFSHVHQSTSITWDGHTTGQKYERLDRLTRDWSGDR